MNYIQAMDTGSAYLAHHGVKGMKWGVRRHARKDAKEMARAKMFYGEGAGNRRKLAKARVEARSKNEPGYEKAYEYYSAKQDMAKHASKAQGERHRKDAAKTTKKTINGAYRTIAGPFAPALAGVALAAGATYAHQKGYDAYAKQELKNKGENIMRMYRKYKKR